MGAHQAGLKSDIHRAGMLENVDAIPGLRGCEESEVWVT